MKSKRQAKIMEIISTTNVETQEQLLQELQEAGFTSTQATISRDIKELRIVKELTSFGTYRYTTAARDVPNTFSGRLNTIFRECVTNFDYAQNIIVIHTSRSSIPSQRFMMISSEFRTILPTSGFMLFKYRSKVEPSMMVIC